MEGFTNRVVAVGENSITATSTTSDTNNLNFFKVRQRYISKWNVSDVSTLQEIADEELQKRINPESLYFLKLAKNDQFTGLYRVGDLIRVRYADNDNFIDINTTLRVFEIDISFNEQGVEQTRLVVAENKPLYLEQTAGDKIVSVLKNTQNRLDEIER